MSRTTVRGTSLWLWVLNALFSSVGWLVWQVLRGVGWLGYRLLLWALAHPRTSLAIGTLTGAVLLIGWQWVVGIVGVVVLSSSLWKAAHRASFEATMGAWLRTWHRRWWTYRRRWEHVMSRCGLRLDVDGDEHYPTLRKVRTTPYWDRLRVEMQVGQELSDYENAGERLRHAFDAQRLAVREIEPGVVGLDVMRRDPFRHEVIPATPLPACTADIDFAAIPVGLDEYLELLTVSVVGGHNAVGGTSGAGKAGFEWNVLRGVAPAIADEVVRPVFIDPKGIELVRGKELLWSDDDYAATEQDVLQLLRRLVDELEEVKAQRGAVQGERDFVPSKETPLVAIFIDELAPLLAYWKRSTRDKIEDLLGILLTQGRALGYVFAAAEIQEVTKDKFTIRDLFQRRIGLRLPNEDATDAMLTDNAVGRGAECHKIPESLPGVLFSFHEKDSKAVRGRLGHVRDEDIDELVMYVNALRYAAAADAQLVDEPLGEVEYIDADDEAGQARWDEAA